VKTNYKINPFFGLNIGIVAFLSLGAAYFTIMPMIMWNVSFDRMVSGATQNYAMIGLWLIYFTNIAFLPITMKKIDRTWRATYVVFLIGVVVFIIFILNPFPYEFE
jgi:hypothetical protein